MTRFTLRAAALLAALALAGCGRGQVRVDVPVDEETRLPEKVDIDVARWLEMPRADLAKLADECDALIDRQREGFRNQSAEELLLPRLHAPRTVPVFRKAKYSAARGFSVPDHVAEGKPDPAVALHLARFGDHEAAAKLAGDEAREAVAALEGGRKYPVEWSRLVGLTLIAAQNKLAAGDPQGAAEIAHVHQQLRKALDAKAAAGPLGAALLPAGRRALAQAAKAYRAPRHNKPALAGDIEKAVADWGEVPRPPAVLGASKAQITALFGAPARGKAVVSGDLDRARDLLALPLPTEAAQALVAHLGEDGRVAEIAVAYRGKLETIYPEPDHLGYHLDEAGVAAKEEAKSPGVLRTTYAAAERYEINRSNRSAGVGAVVRINAGKAPAGGSLRDLGPVSFERGFEANRVGWVPSRPGPLASVEDKGALKALVAGSPLPAPATALLQRDPGADLVASLRLGWPAEFNAEAATKLLPALAAFGPAAVDGVEDSSGSSLRLRWEDAKTKAELRLPYDDRGPTLSIEDAQPAAAHADRARLARQRDDAERAERVREGRPAIRLARHPGVVNGVLLANLKLGQPRAEAEAALPKGKSYRVKQVPQGVSVMILSTPDDPVPHWAGQVLVRFDDQEKVSEIRVRYREGLSAAKKGETLLARLSDGKAGAPESLPSPWAGLWTDLPPRDPKLALLRWQDDETVRTYQRDAGGTEVAWHDRGRTPTPWRFVSQGPKGISLGDAKEAVEEAFTPATTSAGATVYRASSKGPYEMFLVWYEKGRVVRIVAVDRARPGTQPEEVTKALQKAWGRGVDELGAVRRQEGRRGAVLGSMYWNDDATRVQAFVQSDDQGARLMTEWRAWPLGPATATAKK